MEIAANFAVFNAVFDVGLNPILHPVRNTSATMDQGYARSVPPQFKRGDRGRVLRADHCHVVVVVRVRVLIVMQYLTQAFSWDIEHVRDIVISRREYDLTR